MSEHDSLHDMPTGEWGVKSPELGDQLGGLYELTQFIGRGGMGQVWQARDLNVTSRLVAIKFLPTELRYHDEAIEQMRAAFDQIHRLTHQHIGKAFGLLVDARLGPYVVMDLVSGESLRRYASAYRRSHGSISVEHVVALLRPIASALDYAHGESVVHRDVKPENILVRTEPRLSSTLIDFGLAAEVRTTMRSVSRQPFDTRGTLPYMSSEQLKGKRPPAMDQYALAVVAYELLANSLPFDSDTNEGLIYLIHREDPDPISSLSTPVNDMLLKGLAKKPEDRFGSCLEFIDALSGSMSASVVVPAVAPAPPASPVPPPVEPTVAPPVPPSTPSLASVTQAAPPSTSARTAKTRLIAPFAANAAAAGQAACAQELGIPVEFSNSIGMKFRLIPPGEFDMGSKEYDDEQPIHRVKITKPFYLGVYPVTQGEYERIMGTNPSHFKGDPRLPVEQVSWEDAGNFVQRLSQQESARSYRLPSESEWEYACRAGTTTAYWFGDALNGDRANIDGNYPFGTDKKGPYRKKTTVVDTFPANPFGLYDMHGNVWEWCIDWYDAEYYKRSPVEDPVNKIESQYRVLRGGSWLYGAWNGRSAVRDRLSPTYPSLYIGLRVVCELR